MSNPSDLDLLAELGVSIAPKKQAKRTPQEARIIAGFEEINAFVDEHGRPPCHGENRDIFERLYAVRLDRVCALTHHHDLLVDLDKHGLLEGDIECEQAQADEEMDDAALLAQLGVSELADDDIRSLKNVKLRSEVRAAEEIARQNVCDDFEQFKPLFLQVQNDLDTGLRETREVVKDVGFLKADIEKGYFFILGGQIAYVAEVGEEFKAPNGSSDARLRVIYSNGTESNLLLRSLQRALYKDEAGRRITDPVAGPLFGKDQNEGDIESGTIYVLQSLSDYPEIAENREVLHKIGVTGSPVETRIANASTQATFLFSDVKIVATYKLANINRTKLENLLHRFFSAARLDIQIDDRFGRPVKPREWFLVPLGVIDEVVNRIQDGTITDFSYNPATASLERIVESK